MKASAAEIQSNLNQFYGTDAYHRFSPVARNFVLTDGAKYLADAAGAYWLMDAIASHFPKYKNEDFVVACLKRTPNNWKLRITDGNDTQLAAQIIEYSDFPLEEIMLWIEPGEDNLRVIMLPGEH